jgi:hypothetical protein
MYTQTAASAGTPQVHHGAVAGAISAGQRVAREEHGDVTTTGEVVGLTRIGLTRIGLTRMGGRGAAASTRPSVSPTIGGIGNHR